MSVYSDWEADLTSIIEKTNQNLMLLSRFGDRKTERKDSHSYDISTTKQYEPNSRQTLKKAIQERCNQDIAAHRVMPRDNNNARVMNSRKINKDAALTRPPAPLSLAASKHRVKEPHTQLEKEGSEGKIIALRRCLLDVKELSISRRQIEFGEIRRREEKVSYVYCVRDEEILTMLSTAYKQVWMRG